MDKDINRIKVVLIEKHCTGKWLAETLGKDPHNRLKVVHKLIVAAVGDPYADCRRS